MSATLSEQVESLKQQTDLLRASAGKLVGQDLTNYNIGNIASAIDGVTPEPKEEEGYVRPSWYPNVEEILNNAPVIVKDGKTYTPCVGALYLANEVTTAFYRTHTGSPSSAPNYYNCTGCDAYIFSDVVQNDIANANETTLEVGTEISHKWDKTFNITNPDSLDTTGDAVRWAIWYVQAQTLASAHQIMIAHNNSIIELIVDKLLISSGSFTGGQTNEKCHSIIKFIHFLEGVQRLSCKGTGGSYSQAGFLSNIYTLQECIIDCPVTFDMSYSHYFEADTALKKLTINTNYTGIPNYFLYLCTRIRHFQVSPEVTKIGSYFLANTSITALTIPESVSSIGDNLCQYCTSLRSLTLPNTITTLGSLLERTALTNPSLTYPIGVSKISGSAFNTWFDKIILPPNVTGIENFGNSLPIDYIAIPSSTLSIAMPQRFYLPVTTYVQLYNDFDISSINFTGFVPKTIQWLKDLCGWLKDRTGETANTMVLGTANLANANQIFLTFDPNNKRNITWVDEGTEGAISITDFITNQLNWTLS